MENQKSALPAQKVTLTTPTPTGNKSDQAFEVKKGSGQVMQTFKDSSSGGPSTVKVLAILVIMALLGIGSGYFLATYSAQSGKSVIPSALNPNAPQKGQTYGAADTSAYKDTAEGIVREGGIDGEGQFHLERPGGESQHVYMTSSTVDLSPFIGKKVKVWGATQTAQKAGWLMDVGRIQVL